MLGYLYKPFLWTAMLPLVLLGLSFASPAQAGPAHPVAGTDIMLHSASSAQDATDAVAKARSAIGICNQYSFNAASRSLKKLENFAHFNSGAPGTGPASEFVGLFFQNSQAQAAADVLALAKIRELVDKEWQDAQAQPCGPPGPTITAATTFFHISGLESGFLVREDLGGVLTNPAGTVSDDMNLFGGRVDVSGIPFPLGPGGPPVLVDLGAGFLTGDSNTRVLGVPGGTAGLGLNFADPDPTNRGVFVNDPNATADLSNHRELEIFDVNLGIWLPAGPALPNGNVSFGFGSGFTNIDMQEHTAYTVDTVLGDIDGTYRHNGDSDCGRVYGSARFRSTPAGPGGLSFHIQGLAGVNSCQTDFRSDAVVNLNGALNGEGSGSFSDNENFFFGEISGGVDFQCPFFSQARCSLDGSLSTGATPVPVLDLNPGNPAPVIPAFIDYENPVVVGANARITFSFGAPPPGPLDSGRPLPVTAQTPLQVVPQRPPYRETTTRCGSNANIVFSQLSLQLDGNSHNNTGWGRAHLSYDGDPNVSTQFLNLVVDNATVARNLPLRPGNKPGQQIDLMLWFSLGVPDGTHVDQITYGCSMTPNRPVGAPDDEETAEVNDEKIELWSDFWKETLIYQGPQSDKDRLWYPSTEFDVIDSAFHIWELIKNQECGIQECFPAAISNSFKMMLRSHTKKLEHLSDDPYRDNDDTDIRTFKTGPWTGWVEPYPSGAPASLGVGGGSKSGRSNDPKTGFNKFKNKLESDSDYPFEVEIIDDPKDLKKCLEVIRKKGDCKLLGNGHAMLITGVISLKNGDYLFEIADDSKQGKAGGTDVRLVKYDTSANEFSGYVLGGMSMTKGEGTVGGNVIFVTETVK